MGHVRVEELGWLAVGFGQVWRGVAAIAGARAPVPRRSNQGSPATLRAPTTSTTCSMEASKGAHPCSHGRSRTQAKLRSAAAPAAVRKYQAAGERLRSRTALPPSNTRCGSRASPSRHPTGARTPNKLGFANQASSNTAASSKEIRKKAADARTTRQGITMIGATLDVNVLSFWAALSLDRRELCQWSWSSYLSRVTDS